MSLFRSNGEPCMWNSLSEAQIHEWKFSLQCFTTLHHLSSSSSVLDLLRTLSGSSEVMTMMIIALQSVAWLSPLTPSSSSPRRVPRSSRLLKLIKACQDEVVTAPRGITDLESHLPPRDPAWWKGLSADGILKVRVVVSNGEARTTGGRLHNMWGPEKSTQASAPFTSRSTECVRVGTSQAGVSH